MQVTLASASLQVSSQSDTEAVTASESLLRSRVTVTAVASASP